MATSLQDATVADLEAEIARRKAEAEEKRLADAMDQWARGCPPTGLWRRYRSRSWLRGMLACRGEWLEEVVGAVVALRAAGREATAWAVWQATGGRPDQQTVTAILEAMADAGIVYAYDHKRVDGAVDYVLATRFRMMVLYAGAAGMLVRALE